MKKIIISLFLAALMLTQAVFTVSAAGLALTPQDASQPALPSSISGMIVSATDKTITVKSGQTGEIIVLNLGDIPRVVDGVSGQPVAVADMKKGDNVVAYYGPAMTRSIPPQSNALVVICNIPQDYQAPRYAQAESVEKAADGNSVKVTIDNGSIIVTINRDAPIFPYLTRNIVSIDNIKVGSQLLIWYPFVASSYPAQATATKTVILGQAVLSDWLTIENKDMTDSAGSISGALPVFSSDAASDVVKQLNDKVDKLSSDAKKAADAKKNAGVYFTYDVITTTEYTSVVIHTSVNPGNTSSDRVTTFVLNTTASDGGEKYRIYTLEDLLGPNAYKLANSAISKGIAAADPGSYFTGGDGFDGLYSDPSFYVDQDGNAVIIFDKYSIAPGVMGTPAFAIPLGNVVNIAFDAADTLTVDGAALVPLRRVAEALGYAVAWDGGSQTVTMTKGDKASAVKIGDAAFNGGDLTAAPVIHNGLTYIPVAFAELGLGGCYQVNPKTGGVTVSAVR